MSLSAECTIATRSERDPARPTGILARMSTPTGRRDDDLLDPSPEEIILLRDLLG
jgi:hypothetical protein